MGDDTAELLRNKTLDEVYAAERLGETEQALRARYAHCNPGSQRMSSGTAMRLLEPDAVEALRHSLVCYQAEWERIRQADRTGYGEHGAMLDRLANYVVDHRGGAGALSASIVLLSDDEADAVAWLLAGAPWDEGTLTESEQAGLAVLHKVLAGDDKQ